MKFKVGDRVKQINQDYYTTRVGWTGTVEKSNRYTTIVWWDQTDSVYEVDTDDLIVIENNFISRYPKNKPEDL